MITSDPTPQSFESGFTAFDQFVKETQAMVYRHACEVDLDQLTDEQRRRLLMRLNAYLAFELEDRELEDGFRVGFGGIGLFVVSSEGAVQGSEIISDGDILQGIVKGIEIQIVPNLDALFAKKQGHMLVKRSECLAVAVILTNATFSTGSNEDGTFEEAHELDDVEISVPRLPHLQMWLEEDY